MAALENRRVITKNADDSIANILDKSCIRNPVHGRRMDPLRAKRKGASHSDLLMNLKDQFRLVEY